MEAVLVGHDRSVPGKDAQDLLCVINDQGDVALTGVEASLAVRDGLGQVACYLTSVDLCLLAPPPLSTPNGGRYHCSGSECKEGNRSCAHAQAVCPEHGFRQRLLGVRRARSIQKRYRARISIDLNTLA